VFIFDILIKNNSKRTQNIDINYIVNKIDKVIYSYVIWIVLKEL